MSVWSIVSGNNTGTIVGVSASASHTFPNPVTAGDFLVVGLVCNQTSPPTSIAVTDSVGGNTWNRAVTYVGTVTPENRQEIWYCTVTNGGSSFAITVTPNVSSYITFGMVDYQTPGYTVTLEPSGGTATGGTGSNPTAGPLTITGTDLVVGFAGNNDAASITANAGFTLEYNGLNGADESGAYEDQLNVASGPITAGFTTAGNCDMVAAAFLATASGGGGGPFPFFIDQAAHSSFNDLGL